MTEPRAIALERTIRESVLLTPVLERWELVALPHAWLVAGVIAQTFWNRAHAFDPTYGIADVDIVYFDGDDLSEEAEAVHATRVRRRFSDLPVRLDVKNEARIHRWYANKFGYAIEPYRSVEHAIATFPTTATAVGVRPSATGLEICTPLGLDDLTNLIVRPNKVQISESIYNVKVSRWRALWPKLQILGWHE